MAIEIERKFLVANDGWRGGTEGTRFSQGYLTNDPDRTVRVRVAGEKAFLTIKGRSQGISRAEFEYEIPVAEAVELLGMCLPTVIDKTRYVVEFSGLAWEVDVFHGENDGLIVAEVELDDENTVPDLPPWIGAEVSGDPRYFNSRLSRTPYRDWKS
ncbi:MAG: CYTH domain-containing protein [Luteolibacter sp.]